MIRIQIIFLISIGFGTFGQVNNEFGLNGRRAKTCLNNNQNIYLHFDVLNDVTNFEYSCQIGKYDASGELMSTYGGVCQSEICLVLNYSNYMRIGLSYKGKRLGVNSFKVVVFSGNESLNLKFYSFRQLSRYLANHSFDKVLLTNLIFNLDETRIHVEPDILIDGSAPN